MMKKVIVAALSVSLVMGGISPAAAQDNAAGIPVDSSSQGAPNPEVKDPGTDEGEGKGKENGSEDGQNPSDDPQGAELSSKPVGPTDLKTVIGAIVGSLAVGALIAAGVNWAVQSRLIPNPLPGLIPNPPAPPAPAKKAPAKPAPAKKVPVKKAPKPAPTKKPVAAKPAPAKRPAPARAQNVYYQNCKDVWNRLGRPIYQRDAGFSSRFDRDGDGVGCEKRPRY